MHLTYRISSNKTQHNLLYLALLWALIVLPLAACNRNEPTPTPEPAPSQAETTVAAVSTSAQAGAIAASAQQTDAPSEPVADVTAVPVATTPAGRVVLWHSWAQAEGDALAAVLAQLQQAYPDIQVDTLFVAPNELVASYADAVAAGSGPDLLLAPNWWLGNLAEANAVLNLEPFLDSDPATIYWPATVESMRHEGVLYGLPLSYSLVALYVNTALVPPEGIPTDTAALLASASTTTTSGIGLYATLMHTYWGFPAFGAQLLNDQGIVTLDQHDGAAAYLAWLSALNSTPGSYVNSDYGMLLDRFKKGEFAYLVDGPWALADLRNTFGDALSVAPLPAGPSGPAQPWLYADGLFVNPRITPEQQTLAMNVILFLTGDQAGPVWATTGGLLPASRNADLTGSPLLSGFAAQAATASPMPTSPEMDAVWTYGGDMIIKALTNVADADAIVAETTTLINEANAR